MTVMVRRSARGRSATGDYLEELGLPLRRKSQTPVNVSPGDNPVLAELIQGWDETFPEKTSDSGIRIQTSPKVTAFVIGEGEVAFIWRGRGNLLLADLMDTPGPAWEIQLSVSEADAVAQPSPNSPSVGVIRIVEWVVRALDVTDRDVLRAAGIKPRTFYHWKKNPDTAPRLASQAGLWAVAQSVESIVDDLGTGAATWMKADPGRRDLFLEGRHGRLAALAAAEPALRGSYDDPLTLHRHRAVPVGGLAHSDADG